MVHLIENCQKPEIIISSSQCPHVQGKKTASNNVQNFTSLFLMILFKPTSELNNMPVTYIDKLLMSNMLTLLT